MGEILQLDYYYGIEAEQFSFYRVPRLLIKDERYEAGGIGAEGGRSINGGKETEEAGSKGI